MQTHNSYRATIQSAWNRIPPISSFPGASKIKEVASSGFSAVANFFSKKSVKLGLGFIIITGLGGAAYKIYQNYIAKQTKEKTEKEEAKIEKKEAED